MSIGEEYFYCGLKDLWRLQRQYNQLMSKNLIEVIPDDLNDSKVAEQYTRLINWIEKTPRLEGYGALIESNEGKP